jgi:uncharacterized membrane protein YhaH (DUF805 family)
MINWSAPAVWTSPETWRYLCLSFDGRIPRLPFWIGTIAINIVGLAADSVATALGGYGLSAVVALALLYPALAVAAKRAHDRGRSETILIFFFLPAFLISLFQVLGYLEGGGPMGPVLGLLGVWLVAAMIWMLIDFGLMRGQPGSNAYGPPT